MKVKINKLPKGFELKDGKVVEKKAHGGATNNLRTGDQSNFGLVTYTGATHINDVDSTDVRFSLSSVPKDEANLEAEGGETVLTDLNQDGIFGLYDINGPRHSSGGVPMFLPEQSFVFSDTQKMKLSKSDLKEFDINSRKKITPAKVSKKFSLNEFYGKMNDEYADDIQVKSAELMLEKNTQDLSKLAFFQELNKNFDDGVPLASHPYLMSIGEDPIEFTSKIEEISRQQAEQKAIQALPIEQQQQIEMMQQLMAQAQQAEQQQAQQAEQQASQDPQQMNADPMMTQSGSEEMMAQQQPMGQPEMPPMPDMDMSSMPPMMAAGGENLYKDGGEDKLRKSIGKKIASGRQLNYDERQLVNADYKLVVAEGFNPTYGEYAFKDVLQYAGPEDVAKGDDGSSWWEGDFTRGPVAQMVYDEYKKTNPVLNFLDKAVDFIGGDRVAKAPESVTDERSTDELRADIGKKIASGEKYNTAEINQLNSDQYAASQQDDEYGIVGLTDGFEYNSATGKSAFRNKNLYGEYDFDDAMEFYNNRAYGKTPTPNKPKPSTELRELTHADEFADQLTAAGVEDGLIVNDDVVKAFADELSVKPEEAKAIILEGAKKAGISVRDDSGIEASAVPAKTSSSSSSSSSSSKDTEPTGDDTKATVTLKDGTQVTGKLTNIYDEDMQQSRQGIVDSNGEFIDGSLIKDDITQRPKYQKAVKDADGNIQYYGTADLTLPKRQADFEKRFPWAKDIDGYDYSNGKGAWVLKFQKEYEAKSKKMHEDEGIPYVPHFRNKKDSKYVSGSGFDSKFGMHTYSAPWLTLPEDTPEPTPRPEPTPEPTPDDPDPITVPELQQQKVGPSADWWLQDLIKLNAISSRERDMFLPWQPGVRRTNYDFVLEDPSRAIASINEQLGITTDGIAAFSGPQALSARTSQLQGKAAEAISNEIGRVNARNVGTINRGLQVQAQYDNVFNQEEDKRNTKLYDDTQATLQMYINEKNSDEQQYADALSNAITNKANTYNMNSIQDYYNVDPNTGGMIKMVNSKAFDPAPIAGEYDFITPYGEVAKRYKAATGQDATKEMMEGLMAQHAMRKAGQDPRESNFQREINNNPYAMNMYAQNKKRGGEKSKNKKWAVPFYTGKIGI